MAPADLLNLRTGLDEVASLLTPDDEFFEGEGLDRIVGEAVEEYALGETIEMNEMDG